MTSVSIPSPRRSDEVKLIWPTNQAMRIEKCGIVFEGSLSLRAWEALGQRLMSFTDSASWWVADWLAYGESQFKDRYDEAIRRTSLSYQTLRNYAWVARRFDLSRRRDTLSFGHHAEVAALEPPEQAYWLRKAEEHGWSRNQLRAEVRASRRERQIGSSIPGDAVSEAGQQDDEHAVDLLVDGLSIRMNSFELERCKDAATKNGLTVEKWAVRVLMKAAAG